MSNICLIIPVVSVDYFYLTDINSRVVLSLLCFEIVPGGKAEITVVAPVINREVSDTFSHILKLSSVRDRELLILHSYVKN